MVITSPKPSERSAWKTLYPHPGRQWCSTAGLGCISLLICSLGMIGAGFTIQGIGITKVFVPTDLAFIGLNREQLDMLNPRLVPLIAHDRAGFGGAVATTGILLFACVWWSRPSRSLWQALLIGGIAGWSTAIGIHPLIGYTDAGHLAPAIAGALFFFTGLALTRSWMWDGGEDVPPESTSGNTGLQPANGVSD